MKIVGMMLKIQKAIKKETLVSFLIIFEVIDNSKEWEENDAFQKNMANREQ